MVEDVESADGKYNFSDGCGAVGKKLLGRLYQGLPDSQRSLTEDYLPSVFQIR